MFGMLDYRAHKLFLLIFGLPIFILRMFAIFILPIVNVSVGIYFFDGRLAQILVSFLSLFILEIVWLAFGALTHKVFDFMFSLIVDVLPHDDRSKEEAELVVKSGMKAIVTLDVSNTHPSKWDEKLIGDFIKTDWIQSIFYGDLIRRRMNLIRDYYALNVDEEYSSYRVESILLENSIKQDWVEQFMCNSNIRISAIGYLFFIYLLLFQPNFLYA
jgi:hypothetical protein